MSFIRKYAQRYNLPTRAGADGGARKSFRRKILDAADRQLAQLDRLRTAADLDYNPAGGSRRWWWSARAADGRRTIKIYVQGALLEGDATGVVVDDSVEAVRAEVERIRRFIESTSDADWEDEERRRREARERWKQRDRERSLERRKSSRR
ncbi:hypothetical protein DDZ18_10510 [Marinicauda salina]|uniref:Uncharacterized protein n=1 Tax=Marinicauda salina TaxID=2135793 RepID=A0A2U2BSY8_9PROT|nr:hypothetical protein [Marinicauda salina]PWE17122.1 hypothetical protein DDZ18_10510 [Marinicauda salina]